MIHEQMNKIWILDSSKVQKLVNGLEADYGRITLLKKYTKNLNHKSYTSELLESMSCVYAMLLVFSVNHLSTNSLGLA